MSGNITFLSKINTILGGSIANNIDLSKNLNEGQLNQLALHFDALTVDYENLVLSFYGYLTKLQENTTLLQENTTLLDGTQKAFFTTYLQNLIIYANILAGVYERMVNKEVEVKKYKTQAAYFESLQAKIIDQDKIIDKDTQPSTEAPVAQNTAPTASSKDAVKEYIRLKLGENNVFRLMLVRGRRLVSTVLNLPVVPLGIATGSEHILNPMNQGLNGLTIAWYGLRFIANLSLLIRYTVGYESMTEKEKNLGALRRFIIEMDKRWFELFNDSLWVAGNVVSIIAYFRPYLNLANTYLSVALFAYDVLAGLVRLAIFLCRSQQTIYEHQKKLVTMKDRNSDEYKALEAHIQTLIKHQRNEIIRQVWSISYMSVLLIVSVVTIPGLITNPGVILAAVLIAFAITAVHAFLTFYLFPKWLPVMTSNNTLEKIKTTELNLFQPETTTALNESIVQTVSIVEGTNP